MNKKKIKEYCKSIGIDLIGFVKCREFLELKDFYINRKNLNIENPFEESDIDKKINPKHYMSEGKTIITIAFPYLFNLDYKNNGLSLYTRGQDYHKVLNLYLEKICSFINTELGSKALKFVDSNSLPERYIGYLGKIGFIGKNNMLITKKYGSYVFLGEIITDLEVEEYDDENINFNDINKYNNCNNCNLCYDNCPTKSINNNKRNSKICLSYITQKKDIDDKWFKLLNGRIFGCDTCQNICPYNKCIETSNIEEFYPFEFANKDNLNDIINVSKSEFNSTLKLTSCGWRGKNVLSRNILIRKFLFEKSNILDLKLTSKYVDEYKSRILKLK